MNAEAGLALHCGQLIENTSTRRITIDHATRRGDRPVVTGPAAFFGRAARSADVALGGLPNGSGLRFTSGVENDRATSVIWEWVKPRTRAIVWPPTYATSPIVPLPIA